MGEVIYLEEWKRLRHTGTEKPVGGRRRRTSNRGNRGQAASNYDLMQLLELLRHE